MKMKFLPFFLFTMLILTQQVRAFSLPDDILLDRNHGGDGSAWGIERCDSCHLLNFIHENSQDRLRNLVQDKGYGSCAGCHGNNGTAIQRQCITCHNASTLPYASRQQGHKSHNFTNSSESNEDLPLSDANCLTCHDAANMDGVFDINVDLTVFTDQYGYQSAYRHSSDFCLACHNRDHQQAGFEMPGNDYRDPLIAMQDNYSFIDKHGVSKGNGQRTYSGLRADYTYPAVLDCSDCHAMHGTHNEKLIIGNAFNGASRLSAQLKNQNINIDANDGAYAQLCVVCHGMDDLVEDGAIDTGNGLSGVHKAAGSCLDCHRHGMAVQTGL